MARVLTAVPRVLRPEHVARGILMGLLAELQTRTYYEAQGKQPYVVARKRNL